MVIRDNEQRTKRKYETQYLFCFYQRQNKKVVFSDNKRIRAQISRHERLKKHDIYYMITINKLSQYTKNIPKKKMNIHERRFQQNSSKHFLNEDTILIMY